MLKWTVSKRTDGSDITASTETITNTTDTTFFAAPRLNGKPSRRAKENTPHHRRHHQHHQHHQQGIIATPQPLTMRQLIATSTPYGSHESMATAIPVAIQAAQPQSHRKRSAYASTLPTFEVEYSPMAQRAASAASIALRGLTIPETFFGNARYFQPMANEEATISNDGPPALKRRRVLANIHYPSLMNAENDDDDDDDLNRSSQALDDVELSRMIDDILQSRRKPPAPLSTCSRAARRKRLFNHDEDFACVSHKPILPIAEKSSVTIPRSQTPPQHPQIHLIDPHQHATKLQTQHLYPEYPYLRETIELLAGMTTPPEASGDAVGNGGGDLPHPVHRQRGSAASAASDARSPPVHSSGASSTQALGPNSTPTEQIRRCLEFPESPESIGSEMWLLKRQSVASTVSTTSSRYSTRSSASASACVSGSLNVAVRANAEHIEVHVIRCKDLQRSHNGSTTTTPINAYVKVAKLAAGQSIPESGFQRTRVHRDSTEPFFNHRFIFDAPPAQQAATLGERIQLTVWHRDRESKRSEFLGCLAFPLHAIMERSIFGAFALRPQAYLAAVEPAEPEPIAGGCQLIKQIETAASDVADGILPSMVALTKRRHCRDYDDIVGYLDGRQSERQGHQVGGECSGRNVDARYAPSLCVG